MNIKSILFHGTSMVLSDPCKVRSLRFHLKAISSEVWEMQSQLYPACSGVLVSVEVKALHFVLLEDMILIWFGVKVNSTVMRQKWACGLLSQHFLQCRENFWIYFGKGPYICRVNQLHPGQVIKRREETLLWFQTSSLFLPKRNKHLFWVSRRGRLFLLRRYIFLQKPSTHLFSSGQPQNHFTSLSSPVPMYYSIYSNRFRGATELLYQTITIYRALKK